MSEPAPFRRERVGAIMRLRFQRPAALNALDEAGARAFRDAALAVAADPTIRCVLIEGEGRAFMAGGDISAFAPGSGGEAEAAAALIGPLHEGILTLRGQDAPLVAAVQGAAAGAGMSLAMACDLVVAADDAKFISAYSSIGASPDGSSTFFLPRLVGQRRAMEIALLNRPIPADEALALGLVTRVVPAADLAAAAMDLAEKLAAGPTRAYGAVRRLFDQSFGASLAEQLEAERRSFMACARTHDFVEGCTAFLEKREPRFDGR